MAISWQRRTGGRWQRFLALLVILLAMGLRFYRLGAQSFWNDEGNTARLVERSISLIIEGAAGDIHPPGYYLLLHGWRALAGYSEYALRSYSAFCGVLTVAIAVALGRGMGGWRAGLVAGIFAAIHPLSVTYGQEARMYAQLSLATALTLLAAVSLVRAQDHPRVWRTALALAATIALGLYTQYTYVLALVGLNLAFGAIWLAQRIRWGAGSPPSTLTRGMRGLVPWFLAHALGGALFLPWAPVALGAVGWQPPDLNHGDAVRALATTLVAGVWPPVLENARSQPMLVAGALLLLAGLFALATSRHGRRRFGGWAAVAVAVVPACLIAVAGIYRPAYLKFLMMSIAPLSVAWALPFSESLTPLDTRQRSDPRLRLPHWRPPHWRPLLPVVALLPALAIAYGQVRLLDRVYHDPALARDDYRGIVAEIRGRARPGDAILLNAPNQWEVFTYYYGSQPGDILPVHPAPYRPTQAEAKAWVNEVLARHEGGRIFALYWGDVESDPKRHIEAALATQAYKAGERWVTTVRLAQYGVAPAGELPRVPVAARLGESIVLESYAVPQETYRPGDIVPLELLWRAERAIEERLKVFVHLVDADGDLRAQVDMEPQAGFAPTATWQPGDRIVDRYGLALPQDLASGTYGVLIGMYRPSGERLPITVEGARLGDALPLLELTVQADA